MVVFVRAEVLFSSSLAPCCEQLFPQRFWSGEFANSIRNVFEAIAKLNGVEPQAWLTDVLERMVSGRTKAHELERLLPWAWKAERLAAAVNA
jgi:hypothetical protein